MSFSSESSTASHLFFFLLFSFYIIIPIQHPTPHRALVGKKCPLRLKGKPRKSPSLPSSQVPLPAVSRHSSLSPSKVSRPNFNSVLSTAARWGSQLYTSPPPPSADRITYGPSLSPRTKPSNLRSSKEVSTVCMLVVRRW